LHQVRKRVVVGTSGMVVIAVMVNDIDIGVDVDIGRGQRQQRMIDAHRTT